MPLENFLLDRAQTLAFEARAMPLTAQTAHAWIARAVNCAEKMNNPALAKRLRGMMEG